MPKKKLETEYLLVMLEEEAVITHDENYGNFCNDCGKGMIKFKAKDMKNAIRQAETMVENELRAWDSWNIDKAAVVEVGEGRSLVLKKVRDRVREKKEEDEERRRYDDLLYQQAEFRKLKKKFGTSKRKS